MLLTKYCCCSFGLTHGSLVRSPLALNHSAQERNREINNVKCVQRIGIRNSFNFIVLHYWVGHFLRAVQVPRFPPVNHEWFIFKALRVVLLHFCAFNPQWRAKNFAMLKNMKPKSTLNPTRLNTWYKINAAR